MSTLMRRGQFTVPTDVNRKPPTPAAPWTRTELLLAFNAFMLTLFCGLHIGVLVLANDGSSKVNELAAKTEQTGMFEAAGALSNSIILELPVFRDFIHNITLHVPKLVDHMDNLVNDRLPKLSTHVDRMLSAAVVAAAAAEVDNT